MKTKSKKFSWSNFKYLYSQWIGFAGDHCDVIFGIIIVDENNGLIPLQCCASKDDFHKTFNKTSKLCLSLVVPIKLLIIITNLTTFIFIFVIIIFDYTNPLCWLTNYWTGEGGDVLPVIGAPFQLGECQTNKNWGPNFRIEVSAACTTF